MGQEVYNRLNIYWLSKTKKILLLQNKKVICLKKLK